MSVYSHNLPGMKKRWYYQFMKDGQYYRGGTGYPTQKAARDAEAKHRRSLNESPTDTVFLQVCEAYLEECETRKQSKVWFQEKRNFIKKHLRHLFTRNTSSITRPEIEEILNKKAVSSPYMANKYLKFLTSIFNWAVRQEIIYKNPCSGIEKFGVEARIRRLPSLNDLRKVILCAGPKDQKFLELLYATAARETEILDLRYKDCGPDWIILRTRKHKGGAYREDKIPIGPKTQETIRWLKEHGSKNQDDYIFINPRSRTRFLRRPKLLRGLCQKAGVKRFGFHDIRALAASRLAQEGIPLKAIQSRLRHTRVTTTDRYIYALGDGEHRAAIVLDGLG